MRILIADDSALIRVQLEDMLKEAGYEVTSAADGQEAWDILRLGEIRLAVLDWMMPGFTGPEICQKLKEHPNLQSVYAVLLTGKEGAENMVSALEAGASDFITKPLQEATLLARLKVGMRIVDLQLQLTQSQKLEAIGQLAAGIAHEINTPVQYIGDNTRFTLECYEGLQSVLKEHAVLLEKLKKCEPHGEQVQTIEKVIAEADVEYLLGELPVAIQQTLDGVAHVANIVRAMKEFAHPGVVEKSSVDINNSLKSTLAVCSSEWKYVADIETDYEEGLPMVYGMPGELNQVFLNLVVNAAHTIKDKIEESDMGKGTITISTKSDGNWCEVRIADNGCGIPLEAREK
ncbi:MAG: response regulator, partial [Pirellulaceae bacterium]|nr:response regulator [Pirellulaceae bacterium]